ncbi:MAG: IclR family transcriptional regulator [Pseudomonadota bacterium]
MSKTLASRDKGNSFLRVFRILEEVVNAGRSLSFAEISDGAGLPVPTTHRLCKMLLSERLLQYEIDGKRVVGGARLFDFGSRILSGSHLDLERRAILESLVEEIGETCNISIPEGTRMFYADRVESHWPLRMQLPTGTTVPQHCTASGKLYLSQLERTVQRRIVSRLRLNQHTPSTIIDAKEMETELERISDQGYATDNEEFIEGLVAVAVPIHGPNGKFCAGLAVHAPKFRMTMEDAIGLLPTLRTAAKQIEHLIVDDDG